MSNWEVFAVKYAERNSRTRRDSFIIDNHPDEPHPMDYFIWVLQRDGRTILVDTGYDDEEAARRGRPVIRNPNEALAPLRITPVSYTHLRAHET